MRIRKWYADCITDDGTVFVGYAGRFGLGPLALPYRSCQVAERNRKAFQRWTVSPRGAPALAPTGLLWSCKELELDGTWAPVADPIRVTLLDSPGLRLEWLCHMPKATVDVRVGRQRLQGLGYAEELTFEGDPRRIPIRELRWGRFTSDQASLVWIDWRGARPLTLVYRDGVAVDGGTVSDTEIRSGDDVLSLGGHDAWTLRDDVVEESVFPEQTRLRRLIPRSLAGLRETKWAMPGSLTGPGSNGAQGWTIYERVIWP